MCLGKQLVPVPRETHGGSKKPWYFPTCAFGGQEIFFYLAIGPLGPLLNWPPYWAFHHCWYALPPVFPIVLPSLRTPQITPSYLPLVQEGRLIGSTHLWEARQVLEGKGAEVTHGMGHTSKWNQWHMGKSKIKTGMDWLILWHFSAHFTALCS